MTLKKTNLFIVGATKSGTTSLHNYLSQHPDIYMSENKEPHYFVKDEVIEYKGPGDSYIQKLMFVNDESDYQKLFNNNESERIVGESTATYLYYEEAAENIKRYNPEAKIVILLRNPIDRAYSAYMHMRRDGRENELDFITAVELENSRKEQGWMPIWYYKELGLYFDQVQRFLKVFGSENVKIDLYESVKLDWGAYLKDVCNFLDVDASFSFNTRSVDNISGIPRSHFLHGVLRNQNILHLVSKKLLSRSFRKIIKSKVYSFNINRSEKINLQQRKKMVKLFRDDVEKLSSLGLVDTKVWHDFI